MRRPGLVRRVKQLCVVRRKVGSAPEHSADSVVQQRRPDVYKRQTISNVQVNGADVPFSVSEYQEYNEAMLEVTLPADEQAELVMEYSGFPQESRNMSTMQGSKEISTEYLCLENSALSPRLLNVMPGENGYPATIEKMCIRDRMKECVNPTELTAELLNTLIEKILVHEAVKNEDGSREQEVEIFYRFIGKID